MNNIKLQSSERLVRIAAHYNKVKFSEVYKTYKHPRIDDCKAMVFFALYNVFAWSKQEIANEFSKDIEYIENFIEHHESEYNIINHYTKLYDNTITQFKFWDKEELDLAYAITKTNYDYKNEIRYEGILNANSKLLHENSILKIKLNKKRYDKIHR
jgi:hypothetical protein